MIEITEEEFEELQKSCGGICLACKNRECSGVEPDARNYICSECGEKDVFGVEELLIMGEIEFVESEED